MHTTLELPFPRLSKGRFSSITAHTDEALFEQSGIRIAFTERLGGVSEGPFESLNLATTVSDEPSKVYENRQILIDAFSLKEAPCVIPFQVHGDSIQVLPDNAAATIEAHQKIVSQGCDALVVEAFRVAALLCYADCVPVILVSPSGRFAVIHAGWRGVENLISIKTLERLKTVDIEAGMAGDVSRYNAYIGPHIHHECFETSPDIAQRFFDAFGEACLPDARHVDLGQALRISLIKAGIRGNRIADVGFCTACHPERFFSYRAQNGICGRHGAFAVRM